MRAPIARPVRWSDACCRPRAGQALHRSGEAGRAAGPGTGGAASVLRQRERAEFLIEEWPEIRERMQRLGISAAELMADA